MNSEISSIAKAVDSAMKGGAVVIVCQTAHKQAYAFRLAAEMLEKDPLVDGKFELHGAHMRIIFPETNGRLVFVVKERSQLVGYRRDTVFMDEYGDLI